MSGAARTSTTDVQPTRTTRHTIIAVTVELLETAGFDAVQLRAVAKRARVSLSTIYKEFPSRDELVITAMEQWMAANVYGRLPETNPDQSISDGLMQFFHGIYEPWMTNPRMLEAFSRARWLSGGDRLIDQGNQLATPILLRLFTDTDPRWSQEVMEIVSYAVSTLMGQAANREIAVDEILPALERVIFRLTADPVAAESHARRHAR
jgi:TetR/AcrR family transcriptional regulator, cholesterol catabolism regulator